MLRPRVKLCHTDRRVDTSPAANAASKQTGPCGESSNSAGSKPVSDSPGPATDGRLLIRAAVAPPLPVSPIVSFLPDEASRPLHGYGVRLRSARFHGVLLVEALVYGRAVLQARDTASAVLDTLATQQLWFSGMLW
ncbi:unnamed protein product [Ixodes pacificus]